MQEFIDDTTSRNLHFINEIKKPLSVEIENISNSHDKITT